MGHHRGMDAGDTELGSLSLEPGDAAWSLEPAAVLAAMASDAENGLNQASVSRRVERFGKNEIAVSAETPVWKRVLAQFSDPLVLLLLVAIVVSVIAWLVDGATDTPIDAIVIAAIVILNAALGFWQESKALDAVAALRAMTAAHTTVRRDGRLISIPNSDLVPGDIMVLEEGGAVGADARLLDVADRTNMVFRGTAVTRGNGTAVVVATAMDTQIGRIASLIDQASEEPTPLEREIQWLGKMLGIVVVEVPIRGAAQQVTFECRIPVMEVVAEEGTEVTVVAIPPAGTIDRRDEHRVAVEAIEHGLTR